ncbi:MAG: RidA family protein [Pirellulales bacterium]|nr:RidA family protein [Pirellulales bacterium]
MRQPYQVSRSLLRAFGLLVAISTFIASPSLAEVSYLGGGPENAFSEAVVVEGHALAHTAQILPLDKEGQLVGEGAIDAQLAQALFNLEAALARAGTGPEHLIKLNLYVDGPKTAITVERMLARWFPKTVRPAATWAVTRLPHPGALLALDAVAAVPGKGRGKVVRGHCGSLPGNESMGHVAVLPWGDVVYLSGQPEKGELSAATGKSLEVLIGTLGQLGLDRSDVVHVKAFFQPMGEADAVKQEIAKAFAGQAVPPVTLVEWTGNTPVEIEMIASALPERTNPSETVSYYTPPGIKASPLYSRVARVRGGKTIYLSGLQARNAGSGEEQVRDVFTSLQRILKLSGGNLGHLVKATYYCADEESSAALNKIRPEFFDPQRPPAASKAMIGAPAVPGRSVTMDMIAVTGR